MDHSQLPQGALHLGKIKKIVVYVLLGERKILKLILHCFRFPEKIGGNLHGVHYIRDVADADSLISSLVSLFKFILYPTCIKGIYNYYFFQGKAQKVVIVGGGYIGMEVAAATVAWNLDTTVRIYTTIIYFILF